MTSASQAATIDDVARRAGVSRKTVSRFLNSSPLLAQTTRARVAQVIAEMGFVPNAQARGLALQRNFLVALVHDGSDLSVTPLIIEGMVEALAGGDYALVVHAASSLDELKAFLARHRPAGVVLAPPLSEREELAQTCAAARTSCQRLGSGTDSDVPAVDERVAMARLVDWLVAQGHRRIGLVAGPDASLSAQQRELGYLDAMAEHGLDRGPALIEAGDHSFRSGIAAGLLLLEVSPRPTAIIACNDEMALGVLHAAAQSGIAVPDALAVSGFDDTPLAVRALPPLTSVRVPWREMACLAARRLTDPASEGAASVAPITLIERGST